MLMKYRHFNGTFGRHLFTSFRSHQKAKCDSGVWHKSDAQRNWRLWRVAFWSGTNWQVLFLQQLMVHKIPVFESLLVPIRVARNVSLLFSPRAAEREKNSSNFCQGTKRIDQICDPEIECWPFHGSIVFDPIFASSIADDHARHYSQTSAIPLKMSLCVYYTECPEEFGTLKCGTYWSSLLTGHLFLYNEGVIK